MSIDNIYTLEQNELTEEDQLNKQYSLYPNIYKDKNETLNATTTKLQLNSVNYPNLIIMILIIIILIIIVIILQ